MSLADYQEFVYGAGLLDDPDPVTAWRNEGKRQRELIEWFSGRDTVEIKGKDVDLNFSVNYPAASCGAFKNFRPTILAEYFWHFFGTLCIVL